MIRRLVPIGIVGAFSAVLVSYLAYTWQLAEAMRENAAVFSQIYFQVVQAVASPEGMTAESEFALLHCSCSCTSSRFRSCRPTSPGIRR